MLRQLDLFGAGKPSFDPDFGGLVRTELLPDAWIDHVPGWVRGHATLFDELERALPWRSETMKMYDREVAVPRLLAQVPDAHPLIDEMRAAISARYGEAFIYKTAALYRDGNDSVAFHGDTTARDMETALVATVSLGSPRRLAEADRGRSVDRVCVGTGGPRRHGWFVPADVASRNP